MSREVVTDLDLTSAEAERWRDYAQRALEYGFTWDPNRSLPDPTNLREVIAYLEGASPQAMGEMTMYL